MSVTPLVWPAPAVATGKVQLAAAACARPGSTSKAHRNRYHLIGELSSRSQGLCAFAFSFDHLAGVTRRLADEVVRNHGEERRLSD